MGLFKKNKDQNKELDNLIKQYKQSVEEHKSDVVSCDTKSKEYDDIFYKLINSSVFFYPKKSTDVKDIDFFASLNDKFANENNPKGIIAIHVFEWLQLTNKKNSSLYSQILSLFIEEEKMSIEEHLNYIQSITINDSLPQIIRDTKILKAISERLKAYCKIIDRFSSLLMCFFAEHEKEIKQCISRFDNDYLPTEKIININNLTVKDIENIFLRDMLSDKNNEENFIEKTRIYNKKIVIPDSSDEFYDKMFDTLLMTGEFKYAGTILNKEITFIATNQKTTISEENQIGVIAYSVFKWICSVFYNNPKLYRKMLALNKHKDVDALSIEDKRHVIPFLLINNSIENNLTNTEFVLEIFLRIFTYSYMIKKYAEILLTFNVEHNNDIENYFSEINRHYLPTKDITDIDKLTLQDIEYIFIRDMLIEETANNKKQKNNDLIDIFFSDINEYIKFLSSQKSLSIANNDGTCMATLSKENNRFMYRLDWVKDGKYIGDYVIPFSATQENIEIFNQGCKVIAERLALYIKTNKAKTVPINPPAFGNLTYTEKKNTDTKPIEEKKENNSFPSMFVDNNGEPMVLKHNCLPERIGKEMTKDELHKFAVELLSGLYEKNGMTLVNVNRNYYRKYPNIVMKSRNGKLYYVIIETASYPKKAESLYSADFTEMKKYAKEFNATPVFAGMSFMNASRGHGELICGDNYFVDFNGLEAI